MLPLNKASSIHGCQTLSLRTYLCQWSLTPPTLSLAPPGEGGSLWERFGGELAELEIRHWFTDSAGIEWLMENPPPVRTLEGVESLVQIIFQVTRKQVKHGRTVVWCLYCWVSSANSYWCSTVNRSVRNELTHSNLSFFRLDSNYHSPNVVEAHINHSVEHEWNRLLTGEVGSSLQDSMSSESTASL